VNKPKEILPHPDSCVLFCGANTKTAGYIYGACNECVRKLIHQRQRDIESYYRLSIQTRKEPRP
jgi:hypothetical protein